MDTKGIRGPNVNTGIAADSVKTSEGTQKSGDFDKKEARHSSDFAVAFSDRAQEMLEARNKALDIAKSTSPIREDRVQALKAKIQNGTYEIDSGKIADGMLEEAIKDELSKTIEA